ncbi:hypothetical protein FNF27_06829 [Cafeteria roenbergensis]|uniref:Glucosidase 2 subunit beta n=1 Tax=Cafeteria roenbergensis TaxID=33653 RepID=A0A5A8D997_CAFRO|nr:hypothetical protein FNF31_07716 [Cafeteria roenbergensis]KAA0149761.1 hypothetical protein FNF29_05772 [Cafeteria roenbergensis]KAA0160900.1 hypothetical protein FNF28_05247 [Cafeteria roenbergensis]KAA0169805.1 hypothetical protein FNF27_06829 [Cafeteria roenbergensis]|eukprot:KAA0149761.1 hypothetical protein FNF29_05772 [Cafeteria roenbergensis]
MRLSLVVLAACVAAVSAGTRGVPQSKQRHYDGETFTCLDGSATMPSSRVNDDFCDCEDGSDEPGTAACEGGSFFCPNVGFRGKTLPSMLVNDGVCDCCDGSDEWESGKCANTCVEEGREWREHMAERIKSVEQGASARLAYAEEGTKATAAAGEKVTEATSRIEALDRRLTDLRAERTAAEEKGKSDQLAAAAAANDAVATALGLDSLDAQALRRAFVQLARDANAKTQAEGVAKAVARAAASPQDAEAAADAIAWPGDDTTPPVAESATSTVDAEIARVQSDRDAAEADRKSAAADTVNDYGPDSAFYPLKGKCFEISITQYTYKICPFVDAKQDFTSLGKFSGWQEGSDHSVMLFTDGQSCWNGPARSMTVSFECGSEDKVLAVDEPSKCAYSSRMSTPAACDANAAKALRLELNEPPAAAEPAAEGAAKDEL